MDNQGSMYDSIDELPTEVLNALDREDAKAWMDAYNGMDPETEDEVFRARAEAWKAVKELPSSFSFDIVASVEAIDADGELVTLDTIKSQMDDYIRRGGKVQDVHGNYNVGVIHGWEPYTEPTTGLPGILVHGNVFGGSDESPEYKRAREEFVNGKNSLSIGGDASFEGHECREDGCFVRRNLSELMEISLCTVPSNPYAHMLWYNDKALIKSKKDETRLAVKSVDVHKSYSTCDYERAKKAMADSGCRDGHIARDGYRVKADDEIALMKTMDQKGLMYAYDADTEEFIVRTYDGQLCKAFMHGIGKGWIAEDGRITSQMPTKYFSDLYGMNLLKRGKGREWVLNMDMAKDDGAFTAPSEGAVNPMYGEHIVPVRNIFNWNHIA